MNNHILVENETSRLIWTGSRAVIQLAISGAYTDFYVFKSVRSAWGMWCCFYGSTQEPEFKTGVRAMLTTTTNNNTNN